MKGKLTKAVTFKIITDGIIISVSLLAAFQIRLLWEVIFEEKEISNIYKLFFVNYLKCLPLVSLINIVSYYIFGFYNKGLYYAGNRKILCIIQAVSIAYVIIGLIAFMSKGELLPRSVLLISWGISLLSIILARYWAVLWRTIISVDENLNTAKSDTRNILVIGGAGYIGSALLPKLLDAGYRVRMLDLFMYGKDPIQHILDNEKLELVKGDFRRIEDIVPAMKGIDKVIHLGGLVGDPACAVDETLTIEINLTATRLIAEVAKANRISRFVFASTCSVYGASDEILDENSSLNPVSLYAKSKIASEEVLHNLQDVNFNVTIVRFGTIYGFSGRNRFDLVVNLLVAKALKEKKVTLFGGDQWRPFVHVDDASKSLINIIQAPIELVSGEIFNVGSNEQNMTLTEVGELIIKLIPSAELIDSGSSEDRRNYRVKFDKINNLLKFKVNWTLQMGIEQVINSFSNNEIINYKDSIYSNVKQLTETEMNYDSGWEERLINKIDSDINSAN